MKGYKKNFILQGQPIQEAMSLINLLASDGVLFVVDEEEKLCGSITDGDIRRGFLRGLTLNSNVDAFIEPNPKFVRKGEYKISDIIEYRRKDYKILPVLDEKNKIINLINFRILRSYLPVDVVIMAGGRGQRLSPLTDTTPKPLLKVGNKPIIEHNLDRLISFGVQDFWISIKYMGKQIENHFGDGSNKSININYVWEDEPMGTIGAVSKIKNFSNDYILITNSDLLTNIDYEDFFCSLFDTDADICIATVPYSVNMPYAILETQDDNTVMDIKEKPIYTYYANAGIYLIKKSVLGMIPQNSFFNATDLIEHCLSNKLKVHSYQMRGYWLDIGRMEDFVKAQEDINHINL